MLLLRLSMPACIPRVRLMLLPAVLRMMLVMLMNGPPRSTSKHVCHAQTLFQNPHCA
ncbi:unnamed protein product [Periconia digitata]|uniref:Uncharacterized protein n=1 Tax=Periconia digitata TaxID=1303443 RepID=A0A9W4XXD3_9PLEO|nr:unnamed protein product [Periconia digitata]